MMYTPCYRNLHNCYLRLYFQSKLRRLETFTCPEIYLESTLMTEVSQRKEQQENSFLSYPNSGKVNETTSTNQIGVALA